MLFLRYKPTRMQPKGLTCSPVDPLPTSRPPSANQIYLPFTAAATAAHSYAPVGCQQDACTSPIRRTRLASASQVTCATGKPPRSMLPIHRRLLLMTTSLACVALVSEQHHTSGATSSPSSPRQARPLNLHYLNLNQQQQQQQRQDSHLFSPRQMSLAAQVATLRSQLASAGPLELGSACLGPSTDCARWIENGHCQLDSLTCACLPQHVALNATTCLAPALLGYQCRLDAQCQRKVAGSVCGADLRCTCPAHLEPYRKDKCLAASKINDYCLTDRQCQLWDRHSHCKWKIPHVYGLCKCPPNYKAITSAAAAAAATTADSTEIHCAPRLGDACLSSDECRMATPHSECRQPAADGSDAVRPTSWRTSGVGPKRCLCSSDHRESANRISCDPAPTPRPLVALSASDSMDAKHQYELVIPAPISAAPLPTTTATATTTTTTTTTLATTTAQVNPTSSLPEAKSTTVVMSTTENSTTNKPPVRASSLGKPCLLDAECQARDQYSRCIEGRCECVHPTSRCSANATGCHADTFQCRNGQCISWYFVCDNFRNCDDGSDEDGCQSRTHLCPPEAFQCADGGCVARGKQCNGRPDCSDGSDELDCSGVRLSGKCPPRTFQCSSGHCLPGYVFCNAVEDCADGSDEAEWLCERPRRKWAVLARNVTLPPAQLRPEGVFRTTASSSNSSSNAQQPDSPLLKTDRLAIDKMLQTLRLQQRRRHPTPSRQRQSRLGGVATSVTEGREECPRWSFTCRNGKCRSSAILCSAVDGCGDNSDEDRCQVCQCEPPPAPAPPT